MVAGSFGGAGGGGGVVAGPGRLFHRLGNEYLEICGQIQDSSGSLSALVLLQSSCKRNWQHCPALVLGRVSQRTQEGLPSAKLTLNPL